MTSIREVAAFMDPIYMGNIDARRRDVSLRELVNRHRWLPQLRGRISILALLRRHSSPQSRRIRFVQLNTYLLAYAVNEKNTIHESQTIAEACAKHSPGLNLQ